MDEIKPGAVNVDECRVETEDDEHYCEIAERRLATCQMGMF